MGVLSFETWVKNSHTEYFGKVDYQTSSKAQYSELSIANHVDKNKFINWKKPIIIHSVLIVLKQELRNVLLILML